MRTGYKFFAALVLLSLLACAQNKNAPSKEQEAIEIDKSFWEQGLAEVNVYELEQNRYQEIHDGKWVSIFVKEDFLTDKQVKNDNYTSNPSTSVLKNIQIRKYNTGLYDYTLQHAVFTPFDRSTFPLSIKVSATTLDWCGQTFSQLNLKGDAYNLKSFSYFENEADREVKIENTLTEEEIFNLIRMNPELLPLGEFQMIPSLVLMRTQHWEEEAVTVKAEIEDADRSDYSEENLKMYTIDFPTLDRKLIITFSSNYPFKIIEWSDSYPSVFDKKIRVTKAKLVKTEMLPYWKLNQSKDEVLRETMDLE